MIMDYVLMMASVCFAVCNNCLLHRLPASSFRTPGDIYYYNAGVNGGWVLLMLVWCLISGDFSFSAASILYGVVYGVLLVMFLLSKSLSMAEGPVALTTLLGCSSFVICTVFGALYAHETINIFQIIGMLVLFIGMILCSNPKKSDQPLTARWLIYVILFIVAGGLCGILFKVFAKSGSGHMANSMMLSASVTASLLFFILSHLINRRAHAPRPGISKDARRSMVFCSIASCIYIRLNITLSAVIPSAVFFPVFNGCVILLATLMGVVLFKEHLRRIQVTGIILGMIAIILNGCGTVLMQLLGL